MTSQTAPSAETIAAWRRAYTIDPATGRRLRWIDEGEWRGYLRAMTEQAAVTKAQNEKLEAAHDTLREIALAGMSPPPEMSEEAVVAWHSEQAWRFIGMAARAISPTQPTTPKESP